MGGAGAQRGEEGFEGVDVFEQESGEGEVDGGEAGEALIEVGGVEAEVEMGKAGAGGVKVSGIEIDGLDAHGWGEAIETIASGAAEIEKAGRLVAGGGIGEGGANGGGLADLREVDVGLVDVEGCGGPGGVHSLVGAGLCWMMDMALASMELMSATLEGTIMVLAVLASWPN